MGGRAISYYASLLWNQLSVWETDTLSTLKIKLKTNRAGSGGCEPSLSYAVIGLNSCGTSCTKYFFNHFFLCSTCLYTIATCQKSFAFSSLLCVFPISYTLFLFSFLFLPRPAASRSGWLHLPESGSSGFYLLKGSFSFTPSQIASS